VQLLNALCRYTIIIALPTTKPAASASRAMLSAGNQDRRFLLGDDAPFSLPLIGWRRHPCTVNVYCLCFGSSGSRSRIAHPQESAR
jgi:hypothetical protein